MLRATTCTVLLVFSGCATSSLPRGRDFWLTLKATEFAVPPGAEADAVLADSEALLGVPDPVLRDDVGYGLTVAWVYRQRQVSEAALRAHLERLLARLADPSPDASLARSFAALRLSLVVAAEGKRPLLTDAELARLVAAATTELERETDLRGRDPAAGWVHATAHTADLLKFLARHPRLTAAQQLALGAAVRARLGRGPAFTWGEDERLAAVLRSLALRADAALDDTTAWLTTLPPRWQALWAAPTFDEAAYATLSNTKACLRALFLMLSTDPHPSPAVEALRQRVLEASAAML